LVEIGGNTVKKYLNPVPVPLLFPFLFLIRNMAVLSVLCKPWISIINRLEKWVRYQGKDLPIDTDWSNSIEGSW
jgi:hypothetical protein